MTFQKNKLVYMALGASVLSLGACNYSHPNAMPSGYTYHHEEYKSPISPTSKKITVEQRKYMDAAQAEQFRDAVYDLLERLTMRAGMPPKPVYIMAPDPMTTFYANLDNDLRESMRHIGYAISDTPTDAYIFTYEAFPIEKLESQTIQTGANNVHLTLRVFDSLSENARQLTEETGQYFIQGAEALDIVPSSYGLLPSQEKVVQQQVDIVEPIQHAQPAAVSMEPITAPDPVSEIPIIVDEPIIAEPVVEQPVEQIPEAPVVVSRPVKDVPVAPVVKAPEVKANLPTISVPKKPSHDDIIIINRGDKPSMGVSVEPVMPVAPEVMPAEPENALQKAIPTAKDAVRGRVSQPADY